MEARAACLSNSNIEIPDLPQTVLRHKLSNYRAWPVRSNRASQLGHPCERFLVYQRTSWEKEELPSPDRILVFGEGNVHEEAVLRDLRAAGFKVILQQRGFDYKEHQITGSVDAKILINGESIPLEIKSTSPFIFQQINSLSDIRNHKYHYIRAYYAQMNLYLLLSGDEWGILLLKNKNTGQLKQIIVELDYEYAEELIQKADRINLHVAQGTLPDRMEYNEDICPNCSFFMLCLPHEALQAGASLLDDPELEAMLNRREQLKPFVDEYKEIDKAVKEQIKAALGEKGEAVIGTDWYVTVKQRTRKGYTVPETTYQDVKIQRLKACLQGSKESLHA
jgi:CRISPR/Cas system-associated exonuclease Cas4 (RecB family)